ncbi:MAG: homoserine dehydrogenase [Acidobacteria bacterium]|nr:homoserine dehydrogenase [Acidobacteriota bacterium]
MTVSYTPSVFASLPAIRPLKAAQLRTVRIGMLGLGNVGQAVVRACAAAAPILKTRGLQFKIDGALVRDPARPRRCPLVRHVTNDPELFLRGRYDLVVEVLGGVEPARTLIARFLDRGTPVVTANKTVLAASGDALFSLAAQRNTSLRYEASAVAGVPFLGTLERRPLVSCFHALSAILNGTSNSILSLVESEGCSFDEALRRAQDLGYCEPDPSFDIDGQDAADKLIVVLRLLGVSADRNGLEVRTIRGVSREDIMAAHALDGTLKPVVSAALRDGELAAFVGPAFVRRQHRLAQVSGPLNGFCLDGAYVDGLFYSGPGAGPDVTAATILDDAIEVTAAVAPPVVPRAATAVRCIAPLTPWFLRVGSDGAATDKQIAAVLREGGIQVERLSRNDASDPSDSAQGRPGELTLIASSASGTSLEEALSKLDAQARRSCHIFRVLEA